jgi:hypothetical protein
MLLEKIKKILEGEVPPDRLDAVTSKIEELYYKYENGQAKLSIDEQKRELKVMLEPFLEEYGSEMLNKFYSYWTQSNKNGKKCRYKMEKVFSLKGRLVTWHRFNKEREMKNNLMNKQNFLGR